MADRVLVTSWASFRDGEATAGDVLSMHAVADRLHASDIDHEVAYSPGLYPDRMSLSDADPARYTHLLFVCGPVHGVQVERLHERYGRCRRIAVGVSVIDPASPAATGFHRILARDGLGDPCTDLSLRAATSRVPVTAVVLAPGQPEYGGRRDRTVDDTVTAWLNTQRCAPMLVDTRLDTTDWRHCGTADGVVSLLSRADVVVTTRLHGLVLALRCGVPALAVDPVRGGGKVTAQAAALGWPACVAADAVDDQTMAYWWSWCLTHTAHTGDTIPADRPGTDLLANLPAVLAE